MLGGGCLAGVGFTMSIFIASAAFEGEALNAVKLAVLLASAIAAAAGALILRTSKPNEL
jgi:NhaA family Na+:H+ antiporter